jgi:NIPSNAP
VLWSPIVELRQYTLHAGLREALIDLFDSKLVEPQERVGMKVIGQFRDLDAPDRFVWLRGFRDMPGRAQSLADFYDGPTWEANHEAANATMIDSDDVLLLRPARADAAFTLVGDRPPACASGPRGRGFVGATVMQLEAPAEETEIVAFFEYAITPTVVESGGSILAYFVTEPSPNTFPRLPVREHERVFVWFAGYPDRKLLERGSREDSVASRTAAQAPALSGPPQVLRLEPTVRSLLHGLSPACPATVRDRLNI